MNSNFYKLELIVINNLKFHHQKVFQDNEQHIL